MLQRKLDMLWVKGERVRWDWPLGQVMPPWGRRKFADEHPGAHVFWKNRPEPPRCPPIFSQIMVTGVKLHWKCPRSQEFTYGRDEDY
jgi:hypothetical protein